MTETTGTRIKHVRKLRGLTQEQLAEKLDYSQKATISKIENDRQAPSMDMLEKMAKALNTTFEYLALKSNDVEPADPTDGVTATMSQKEYVMLMKYRSMSLAAQEVFEKMLAL